MVRKQGGDSFQPTSQILMRNRNALRGDAALVINYPTARFLGIVSNPPFHEEMQTDYQVVTTFFKQAATYLAPEGRLRIVANRFLKYPPLIEAHIGKCRILAENAKYRVYEATCENKRRTEGQAKGISVYRLADAPLAIR